MAKLVLLQEWQTLIGCAHLAAATTLLAAAGQVKFYSYKLECMSNNFYSSEIECIMKIMMTDSHQFIN